MERDYIFPIPLPAPSSILDHFSLKQWTCQSFHIRLNSASHETYILISHDCAMNVLWDMELFPQMVCCLLSSAVPDDWLKNTPQTQYIFKVLLKDNKKKTFKSKTIHHKILYKYIYKPFIIICHSIFKLKSLTTKLILIRTGRRRRLIF